MVALVVLAAQVVLPHGGVALIVVDSGTEVAAVGTDSRMSLPA